jgi:N-acetyl-beta-hexosaminidase
MLEQIYEEWFDMFNYDTFHMGADEVTTLSLKLDYNCNKFNSTDQFQLLEYKQDCY